MSLRHLFFPQTLNFPDTKFNKNISLHRYFLQPTLMVDGLIESGDILTHIWKTALNRLVPKNFSPQKILVLGLGGGSNTLLVSRRYPNAQITAVDIDPLMMDIAFRHFGLDKVKNLKVVISDALDFANKLTAKDKYDISMIDCFEGKYIPKKLEDLKFIQQIYRHSRYTLINRIRWRDQSQSTVNFIRSLGKKFIFTYATTSSNVILSLV